MSAGRGPDVRIGDDEREAAVTALGEHYAAGRLTKEEFDERSEQAWSARTQAGLVPLFADLPRPGRPAGEPFRGGPPRRGPLPTPGRGPGRWGPAWLVPVLAVLVGFFVLMHLPLILLVVLVWVLLVRGGRRWARRTGHGPHGPHGHGYGRGW